MTDTTPNTILGKHVLTDLDVGNAVLPTRTSWGSQMFQNKLKSPTADRKELRSRQLPLLALRTKATTEFRSVCRDELTRIGKLESAWDDFTTDIDPRIRESVEQILWSKDSMGSFLNTTPRVVSSIVFWKTLFLPIVSLLLPILAVVAPLFILRFVHGTPVETHAYFENLKGIALKQVAIPDILRAKHDADWIGHGFEWGFLALTVFTFFSSIWTQCTAAFHLRSIALEIAKKGDTILEMVEATRRIVAAGVNIGGPAKKALQPFLMQGEKVLETLAALPSTGSYTTYGFFWNAPHLIPALPEWIGMLDCMLAIAESPVCFPIYRGSLQIRGVFHPSLASCVRNDAVWERPHAILTGPNRGGKSTFCRAVGLAVLTAQTWGFAFADSMQFQPFSFIETALHPADSLGQLSLFEAEIEFAKTVLQRAKKDRMFVMMDEIFHSTNARDGLAASRVFLSQLFACRETTSLISTHYKELPTEFNDAVAWCMEAEDGPNNCLTYSYKKVPGISDKSSVMEILRERGLVPS